MTAHERAYGGVGPDDGGNRGAYCPACSEAADTYIWPCEVRLDKLPRFVLQDWLADLTFMQQSVLLTAVRGPDGLPKYHPVKYVVRWYRRAILRSSFLGEVISEPYKDDGGSFLGASLDPATRETGDEDEWYDGMNDRLRDYIATLDEVPHHFQLHLLHAFEIVGYKHPDPVIRAWFEYAYRRLVKDMHLYPESEAQLDERLGDTRAGWLAHADDATIA